MQLDDLEKVLRSPNSASEATSHIAVIGWRKSRKSIAEEVVAFWKPTQK